MFRLAAGRRSEIGQGGWRSTGFRCGTTTASGGAVRSAETRRVLRDAALLGRVLGLHPACHAQIARSLEGLGGLGCLASAGASALGLDGPAHRKLDRLLRLFDRMISRVPPPAERIERPEDVVRWLGPRLVTLPVETFWVVLLDARGRAVAATMVAQGILTSCLVHPREVFAVAIRARAASLIVIHNHPSGDPEPSAQDRALTARLCAAGRVLGIPVLDHIVVGRQGFVSVGPLPDEPALGVGGERGG